MKSYSTVSSSYNKVKRLLERTQTMLTVGDIMNQTHVSQDYVVHALQDLVSSGVVERKYCLDRYVYVMRS